jgi:7-cyano-7-deazaguanine synthase
MDKNEGVMVEMGKPKALILFSGGFDSVVLLHDLLKQGYYPILLFISYGQKPLEQELNHARYWSKKYNLFMKLLTIQPFSWSKSAMFEHGEEYVDEVDNDYIELRNLVFFSYAASMAESLKIKTIASAILFNNFPDTNPTFCKGFDSMLYSISGIELYTPYQMMDKEGLGDFAKESGFNLREILDNSISCNVPVGSKPCGECKECKEISKIKQKLSK